MTTAMVLDALGQAFWTRQCEGHDDFTILEAHCPQIPTHIAIRYCAALTEDSITPWVGAVGSFDDNALADTINGRRKTEVIRHLGPARRGPGRARYRRIDRLVQHPRLFEYGGDVLPLDLEQAHYDGTQPANGGGRVTNNQVCGHPGRVTQQFL